MTVPTDSWDPREREGITISVNDDGTFSHRWGKLEPMIGPLTEVATKNLAELKRMIEAGHGEVIELE
jgi:hypothetical protein